MKITNIILAFILLSSISAGCSNRSSENNENRVELERTYNGEFFSIDYPQGFTPLKVSKMNPGVIISSKDKDFRIETYANWNGNCREGDLYRLWHNGEEYWDELTETQLGDDPALFAYTKDEYKWAFVSTTIPKLGWEMIATVSNFSEDEFDLAKQIVMSMRITDRDYTFEMEGPQYEPFDHSQELQFSDKIIETELLKINTDGKKVSVNTGSLRVECDDYKISILPIDDWKTHDRDIKHIKVLQNWKDVELGASVIKEIKINEQPAIWSETLKDSEKSITVCIPLEGGYILAVASGLDSEQEIASAGASLYSIEVIDSLQFRTR